MFHIHHQNLYKLFTHEDNSNIHKTLGVISLTHFAVRFYNLFMYGDMLFTGSFADKTLLLCHLMLSITDFCHTDKQSEECDCHLARISGP